LPGITKARASLQRERPQKQPAEAESSQKELNDSRAGGGTKLGRRDPLFFGTEVNAYYQKRWHGLAIAGKKRR